MIERISGVISEHPREITATSIAIVAAGALAYKHFKPETHHEPGQNVFDIVKPLDEQVIKAGEDIRYYMLGGCSSAALANPNTVIDIDSRTIMPPLNIRKDQFRKENGTRADMDLLVLSTDDIILDRVRSALEPNQKAVEYGSLKKKSEESTKIGNELKIGVSGLYEKSEDSGSAESLGQSFKKDWVSKRTMDKDGRIHWSIGDVEVELPAEYFDPWYLQLPDSTPIPVLHPLIQVACYLGRASHGIRARDIEKVTKIMDNFGDLLGAHLEWGPKQHKANIIVDGEVDKGVQAAVDFVNAKNELHWDKTHSRMGLVAAGALATKQAFGRQFDTRKIFVQFGQGGDIFDKVLSNFTGERQQELPS